MITRRLLATGAGAAALCSGLGPQSGAARASGGSPEGIGERLRAIETESGGRLGVAVLDTASGARAGHRADERFPMCSTFKVLAAAAILARVDEGQERLDRRIRFGPADLVVYSPVTGDRTGGDGMSLAEICAAAITMSDNTAGNLMLALLGGPAGLTGYLRTLGDVATRLDRPEPDLNEARPDDPRDTTTPAAMIEDLRRLVLGDALSASSRERLTGWLVGNRTGDTRLRAGMPAGWRVGDKTGAGERGTTNDVGVIWPPGRGPIVVAAYLTASPLAPEPRNAAIAAVGRAVASAFAG